MYLNERLHGVVIVLIVLALLLPLLSVDGHSEEGTSDLIYEYHFDRPTIDQDSDERIYTSIGLQNDSGAGSPILPIETICLAIDPHETVLNVDVVCSDGIELEIAIDYPRNPAESRTGDGTSEFVEGAHVAYRYSGCYVMDGVEIVYIDLWPIHMDEGTGTLLYVSDFTITITTEEKAGDFIGDLENVRELVDNPEELVGVERSVVSSSSSVLPSASYDYLIITSEDLQEPFQVLADWKANRNDEGSTRASIASVLVTLEDILSDSAFWGDDSDHGGTGNDTQTIVRNFILAAYQEWGIEYVLIGGDEDVIPSRKVYVTAGGVTDNLPADIYYSALDGDWDDDNDGRYGETATQGSAGEEADLLAEVYVGRAPASTTDDAWNFVNKTILYEKSSVDQYSTDLLFVGEKLDSTTYGDWYKDEVYDDILSDEGLSLMTLYEEEGTFSGTAFVAGLGSGVHVVNHMGHGSYNTFGDIYISDVQGLENGLPFLLYTQACMVAGFDQETDCIGEEFVTSESGAVAFIGNSRYGWYAPSSTSGTSQLFDLSFFSQLYDDGVTAMGMALSLSKQEHASAASSSGATRWVYMELNLLGDPETHVLMDSDVDHDLSLKAVVADDSYWEEECKVTIQVQNLGKYSENSTIYLYAESELVDTATVTIMPGYTASVDMYWTPYLYREYELSAEVVCTVDGIPANDVMSIIVPVNVRITENTTWRNDTIVLPGGFVVEDGVVLDIDNCTVILPSGVPLTIEGYLKARNSEFDGSSLRLSSNGSVELEGCALNGLSDDVTPTVQGGSVVLSNTTITGGAGWSMEGTELIVLDSYLIDQTTEWNVSLSAIDIQGLTGESGGGLRLSNDTGAIRNMTWSNGTMGLTVEWSGALIMHDIVLTDNDVDITISGDDVSHFLQDIKDVELTHGQLSLLYRENGTTINGSEASLYLVDCHDTIVKGMHLQGNGQGLTLIGCSDISVVGNVIEDNLIGIMAIDSEGTFWSNDIIANERQVRQTGSLLTFNLDYPAGGNYWSDNAVIDVYRGEDQDESGADGTDDHPYTTADVLDQYPKVAYCSFMNDAPRADFIASSDSFDTLTAIVFTDLSESGSGITNWTWEFGDGEIAYGSEVEHLYGIKGVVHVTLTVTDAKGSVDSTSEDFLVVNYAPECQFSYSPSQPDVGESVFFSDLSIDTDGEIGSWSWDFGDGTHSSIGSPTHAYLTGGDYYVTLEVMDAEGAVDSYQLKVSVGNEPPVMAFTWSPTSPEGMDYVTFTADCTDTDGEIVSWEWNFGDGTSADGSVVTHRFLTSGTYVVTLTATDDDGAQGTTSASIYISNARPSASFKYQNEALTLESILFIDRSDDPDGRIVSWSWTFGDGSSSSVASPEHAYQSAGTYYVTLTVMDNQGSTASKTVSITIMNRLPQVSIDVATESVSSFEEVELTAVAFDTDGEIVQYHWEFGDGSDDEGMNVTHAYSTPGNYTVVLTCVDDRNGTSTAILTLVVNNILPVASFDASQTSALEMTFIANATDLDGSVVAIEWEFGDGSTGVGRSITHSYSHDGDYLVNLTVTDDLGGRYTLSTVARVLKASVTMNSATCEKVEGEWVFVADLVNDGSMETNITLVVNADGKEFITEVVLLSGESKTVYLPLPGFEEGNITAIIESSGGWDSDLTDNGWVGSVTVDDEADNTIFIAIVIAVIAAIVAMAVLIRKR